MGRRRQYVILGVLLTTTVAGEAPNTGLDVPFETVYQDLVTRAAGDELRTAIISSEAGLQTFRRTHGIPINAPAGMFGKKVLIVGFSDRLWCVGCDSFKHQAFPTSASYYMDLHWTGEEIDIEAAPPGKKYSGAVVIAVSNKLKIQRVWVREAADGEFKRFSERCLTVTKRPPRHHAISGEARTFSGGWNEQTPLN